jgi:hypothetical protein
VFFGSTCAVALTLFVVPALYVTIARNTKSPQHVSRLLQKLGYRSSASDAEGETA